jgi:hypothetical protein
VESRLACSESEWRLKGKMINSEGKRSASRTGGVPDVMCEVGKGSTDGDGGVQNEIEGCKSSERSANGD